MFKISKFHAILFATCAYSSDIDPEITAPATTPSEMAIFHKKPTPYNHHQHEVKQFLEKQKQTKTPIRNDLHHPVMVRLLLTKDGLTHKEKQVIALLTI